MAAGQVSATLYELTPLNVLFSLIGIFGGGLFSVSGLTLKRPARHFLGFTREQAMGVYTFFLFFAGT